jgi:hypothetical protein
LVAGASSTAAAVTALLWVGGAVGVLPAAPVAAAVERTTTQLPTLIADLVVATLWVNRVFAV